MAEVRYHPEFVRQLKDLASKAESEHWLMELLGEVMALLRALEDHGHDIEGYQPADASHPIVTSRFRAFALRRTPPTVHTPYAEDPPILRIPYVWFDRADGSEVAVVMFIGDKTQRGREWYPWAVRRIEETMIGQWHRRHPDHRAQAKRTR